jgi:hypothetical protein
VDCSSKVRPASAELICTSSSPWRMTTGASISSASSVRSVSIASSCVMPPICTPATTVPVGTLSPTNHATPK